MLDYENAINPFPERKNAVSLWKKYAVRDISESSKLIQIARDLSTKGLKSRDSIHMASAIMGECEYFISTDKRIINKRDDVSLIKIMNPVEMLKIIET